jgi:hypothetical protein
MHVRQFRDFVIRPVLSHLDKVDPGIASPAAEELLLGTIAHESGFRFLDQVTGPADRELGPAIGLYQVEPRTRGDIHDNYLAYKPSLARAVAELMTRVPMPDQQLATNLAYATAVARLVYRRSPVSLAAPGDVGGHARVWKRVYNTSLGAGREEQFVEAWRRLVAPHL